MRAAVLGRLADMRAAITTLPDAETWRRCLLVYVAFLACVTPLGLASGFLQPGLAALTPARLAVLPIYLLLRPALVEELFFRAALLPRDCTRVSKRRLIGNAVVALVVFVASHPLHGWLTRPAALTLFSSPIFLTCATLLGIACTLTYLISRSLWPPVLLHWISVLIWITMLGGQGLVGTALQ
jgi:predicted Abi (CAAX) family protease